MERNQIHIYRLEYLCNNDNRKKTCEGRDESTREGLSNHFWSSAFGQCKHNSILNLKTAAIKYQFNVVCRIAVFPTFAHKLKNTVVQE